MEKSTAKQGAMKIVNNRASIEPCHTPFFNITDYEDTL